MAQRSVKKQKTIGKLKKELWTIFARLIKLRYSEDGRWTNCFTCEKPIEIGTSNCHAGHWLVKSAYTAFYFSEQNVRPQCYVCNVHKSGDSAVFQRNLELEIGKDAVEEMYENRHKTEKRSRTWYLEQIEYYKEELKLQEGCFQ